MNKNLDDNDRSFYSGLLDASNRGYSQYFKRSGTQSNERETFQMSSDTMLNLKEGSMNSQENAMF